MQLGPMEELDWAVVVLDGLVVDVEGERHGEERGEEVYSSNWGGFGHFVYGGGAESQRTFDVGFAVEEEHCDIH